MRVERSVAVLISEAFELYRQDVIIFKNQSRSSEDQNISTRKSLVAFAGDIQIEDLSFEIIRNWKQSIASKCADNTTRGHIIKLRVVLTHMRRLGVKAIDPELVPVPQRGDVVPKFISPEEVAALIAHSTRLRTKAVISLLYASGIRLQELCSLDRGQIQDKCFTVVGKGRKARLCFIDNRTQALLDKYLATRTDNNPALFISQTGRRISGTNVELGVKIAARKAGLAAKHITPHVLRHAYATNLLRNNTNMRHVQVLMGHASLQTTQMYTHVIDMDLQAIYRAKHTV